MARRRRRVWRWALAIAIVVGMALGVLALATWRLAGQTPDWWANLTLHGEGLSTQAEHIENLVTSELHRADRAVGQGEFYQSEPWTLVLTDADANAWLNDRLPRWAENQIENFRWPFEIAELQVSFVPGSIRAGVRVASLERVVSAALAPSVREDGSVWIASRWMHVGRLPVPTAWVLERFELAQGESPGEDRVGEALSRIRSALAGNGPVMHEPIVHLADGRRVRILSIELGEGALTLTCRTEFEGE